MDKGKIAVENFNSGLNCCQSVVLAFKDEIGLSEDALKKASIPFGGGLGRQRLTCGAVSGMCMVIGLLKSDGIDKIKAYEYVQQACKLFKEQTGSIICSELLSDKKIPCAELCRIATEIAQKICFE